MGPLQQWQACFGINETDFERNFQGNTVITARQLLHKRHAACKDSFGK